MTVLVGCLPVGKRISSISGCGVAAIFRDPGGWHCVLASMIEVAGVVFVSEGPRLGLECWHINQTLWLLVLAHFGVSMPIYRREYEKQDMSEEQVGC